MGGKANPMDGVIQIGPLALATERLIAVAAIWAFLAVAAVIAARLDSAATRAAWVSLLAGLVAARIAFILGNLEAFIAEPWTIIAIWQGGFSVWAGAAAAVIVIGVMLGRKPSGFALVAAAGGLVLLHLGAATLIAPDVRPMPRLTLKDLDGKPVELGIPGQPMVINLWATWCPPCRREMPMLIDVAQRSRVPVLLVNQGEDAPAIRSFLTKQGLPGGAIVTDPGGGLGQAVASVALPTTLFVNAAGEIAGVHAGEISRAALTAGMRDLQRTR
jgi:cytochrome c biogenesis protein CcmG/thiol:disulfide interchange protein DsbE